MLLDDYEGKSPLEKWSAFECLFAEFDEPAISLFLPEELWFCVFKSPIESTFGKMRPF